MSLASFSRNSTQPIRIGEDRESLLGLTATSGSPRERIDALQPDVEQVVVARPVEIVYQQRGDAAPMKPLTCRYVEFQLILGTVHTIIAIPHLKFLDQDNALALVETLFQETERHGWELQRRYSKPNELRAQLSEEKGYFYSRFAEVGKNGDSLLLSLKRVERPTFLPWQTPLEGYLVNLLWNNEVKEETLRHQLRKSRSRDELKPEPIQIRDQMDYPAAAAACQ